MPAGFAETPEGLLLIADGYGPVLRWDGFTPQAETAGVDPPETALVLSSTGAGPIVGTYSAYIRFVDSRGNVSGLSPLSAEHTPVGRTGSIVGATNVTPIAIGSFNHGLTTGTVVKVEGVGGNTGANGTYTITVFSNDVFTLDGSSGTGAYSGGGTWTSGAARINYSSVPISQESKVKRRQIFRNTDGQAITYYLDIDTTNLTSNTLASTKTDDQLQAEEFFAVIEDDGTSRIADNGVPPYTKSVMAYLLGRMFYAVDVEYSEGAVGVTRGSKTVTGVATEWTAATEGRSLYVVDGVKEYLIESIDAPNQTLTLVEAYSGSTDPYAAYSIRPAPGERRTVFYSQPGKPESCNPLDSFSVPEDGDTITGLMPKSSWLFVVENRHIYRFTFQNDPAKDGGLFIAGRGRGCVNNRCWVVVEEGAYMLDAQGVHLFDQGRKDEANISTPIQDLFRPDADIRINWSASRYFHAVHDSANQVIRWFVALNGQYLPHHALCYAYELDRWGIETYDRPVGCSAVGKLARQASAATWGTGRDQVFLGTDHRTLLAFGQGPLDGLDPQSGPHRIAVTTAGIDTLTLAEQPATGVINCPVVIVAGKGKGQIRRVVSLDGSTIQVKTPWAERPDSTSVVQLGGIPWEYQTGWFRWVDTTEDNNPRRIEIVSDPTRAEQTMTLRRYRDRSPDPVPSAVTRTADGVTQTAGDPDLTVSLNRSSGFVHARLDGGKELLAHGPRLVSIGLSGTGGGEATRIHSIIIDGAVKS